MKTSILSISVICSLLFCCVGCTSKKTPAKVDSGVIVEYMDSTTRPGNNFYQFANGNWIRNAEIPSNRPSYWMGTLLYENSQKNFQKIIEKSRTVIKEDSPVEFLIGSLYNSYLDTVARQSTGINPLKLEIDKIDAVDNAESLMAYFAYSSKFSVISPFKYDVYEGLRNPQINALFIGQSGLTLPSKAYYLNNDNSSKEIRNSYSTHISNMFQLAGINCDTKCVGEIIDLEKSLASYQNSKEENRDYEKQYNPFTIDSLNATFSNLNWSVFFNDLGTPNVKEVIIRQPKFINGVDQLVASEPLSNWKYYLKWQLLHSYADYLNSEIGDENFEFYGSTLEGIPEQFSLSERASGIVSELLGEVVGKIYVEDYFSPHTKVRMDSLVSILKLAYKNRIEKVNWMSEDTKEKALSKLSKMKTQIGYPQKWRDFSDIELKNDNLFGNIKSLSLAQHNELISRVEQRVDDSGWWHPPHIPNAYYNQNRNEVVFTAAILQPPLFNLDVDEAVIYGVVGGLIGHEITHGFDDEGGDFDENGVLENWWSESSQEEFNKRSKILAEQYNSFTVLDSIHLNGSVTLGENIADLGSLNIALEAYKLSLNGEEPDIIDGFTGLQRVFLGYAQIWRGKYRDEALIRTVKSGHHSPRMFRVNGVVRNIPEFYSLFNVTADDSLYLPPNQRVKIW